jgi:hypothetical protein
MVEFGEAQEVADDLDLGRVHMHPMFIHDVSQVLSLLHVE